MDPKMDDSIPPATELELVKDSTVASGAHASNGVSNTRRLDQSGCYPQQLQYEQTIKFSAGRLNIIRRFQDEREANTYILPEEGLVEPDSPQLDTEILLDVVEDKDCPEECFEGGIEEDMDYLPFYTSDMITENDMQDMEAEMTAATHFLEGDQYRNNDQDANVEPVVTRAMQELDRDAQFEDIQEDDLLNLITNEPLTDGCPGEDVQSEERGHDFLQSSTSNVENGLSFETSHTLETAVGDIDEFDDESVDEIGNDLNLVHAIEAASHLPDASMSISSTETIQAPKSQGTIETEQKTANTKENFETGPEAFPEILSRLMVRPPFPAPVQDRSPVSGLSSQTLLRICFRLGQAINVGCEAARFGKNIVLELYARVISSERESSGTKQHFTFVDLFHDHAPHLVGVFELWRECQLYDDDSAVFLDSTPGGRLCRAIGRMKRVERRWKLIILNIWEAGWDDIEYVGGIIFANENLTVSPE